MSNEENKAILRRFIEEVANQGNLASADELVAAGGFEPDGVYPGTPAYSEGIKRYFTMLRSAFPDLHYTIEEQIADDDKVVFLTQWHGTHSGEYLGIPSTGKHVMSLEIVIAHIQDGKMTKHIAISDHLDIMEQLGITQLPEPTTG